ncbi:3-dehydroquinate synthase [compost metagenome]
MTIKDLQSPVLKGLAEFREHLGGKLTITLLTDLGTGKEVHEISPQLLVEASTYITNFLEKSTSLNFNNN